MEPVCRAFAGESDIEALLDLIKAMVAVDKGDLTVSRDDIQFDWIDEEAGWRRDLRVWEVGGQFIAAVGAWHEFGNPADTAYAELTSHPDWRSPARIDAMLRTTVDAVAGLIDRPVALRFGASETQNWLIDGAERTGFALDRTYYRMVRDMPEPISPARLPEGFLIRPLNGASDIEPWVDTFNRAFDSHHDAPTYTVIEKQHRMEEPAYLPETDLVLVAPDGSLAGISLNTRDRLEGGEERAWVRSIGIRPEWRGKGLGSALLRASLNALFEQGFRTARLSVDSDNTTTALDLYKRAGFEIEFRRMVYVRLVEPA